MVNQSPNPETFWPVPIDLEWVKKAISAFLTVSIKATSMSILLRSKSNTIRKCTQGAPCIKLNSSPEVDTKH